jgi:tetratricopeptide (TPR) repeat protein
MQFRIVLSLVCLAVLAVYLPGLSGPFVFDDIPNIVNNPAITGTTLDLKGLTDAARSGSAGPLARPIAYVSFALNAAIADGIADPSSFKLTNVLIHLLNTVLVYLVTRRLLRQLAADNANNRDNRHRWVPVIAAAMWSLHPLHTTTVLHVVQRMNSLSACFVLLGTLIFLTGRSRLPALPRRGWPLMGTGLGVGLMGLLAKENAAVMPFLLLTIEYTVYAKQPLNSRSRDQLRMFYFAVCGLPLLLAGGLILVHPDFISDGYIGRDFGPDERLLTQARVLWFYLGLIAVPDLTRLTLFHDDFPLSIGLVEPWTTLPAVAGVILIVIMAMLARHRLPLLSLAILWFLVGHGIESTVIGLELIHEHRNYLPSVMLFVAMAQGIASAFQRPMLVALMCFILVLTYGGITFLRSQTWSREDTLIESMVHHHPLSARSQAMMGELLVYRQGSLEKALPHYRSAINLAPSNPAFAIQMVLATARFTAAEKPNVAPSRTTRALPNLPALSDRISRQLAARRPSLSTLDVLDSTVDCVVETPQDCRDIYPHILRWCLSLLDDPDINPDTRSFAIDRALHLMVWNKEYQRSLEIVARARQAEPANDYYAFLEADIYFRIGKLDEAERIATAIDGNSDLRKKTVRLLSMITAARSEAR